MHPEHSGHFEPVGGLVLGFIRHWAPKSHLSESYVLKEIESGCKLLWSVLGFVPAFGAQALPHTSTASCSDLFLYQLVASNIKGKSVKDLKSASIGKVAVFCCMLVSTVHVFEWA